MNVWLGRCKQEMPFGDVVFSPHVLMNPNSGAESGPDSPNSDDARAFVLNAVMKGYPALAMINGRIVTVGDRINGAVVEEIGSYSVRLRLPDGVRTLRVVD